MSNYWSHWRQPVTRVDIINAVGLTIQLVIGVTAAVFGLYLTSVTTLLILVFLLFDQLGYLRQAQASEDDAWKLVEIATDTMAKSTEHLRKLQEGPHLHEDGSVHVLWERKDRLN